jgi:hypothetical protein
MQQHEKPSMLSVGPMPTIFVVLLSEIKIMLIGGKKE